MLAVRVCVCVSVCVRACLCVSVCVCPGVLIYFGYGMWNSKLELHARESEVHASTYQRYDQGVDEGFCGFDDDFYPPDVATGNATAADNDPWGAEPATASSGMSPPPEGKPRSGEGAGQRGGARTVANHGLAEEDPMDF